MFVFFISVTFYAATISFHTVFTVSWTQAVQMCMYVSAG